MGSVKDLNDMAQDGQTDPDLEFEEVTGETDDPNQPPLDAYDDLNDERAKVTLVLRVDHLRQATIYALRKHDDLFVYARKLVLLNEDDDAVGGRAIHTVTADALLDCMSSVADFVKLKFDPEKPTEPPKDVPVPPPMQLARTIERLGKYPGVRRLAGITTRPILHPDGSVATDPGYDPVSRLWYAPLSVPDIRPRPTQEDARDAVKKLLDLVGQFPFVADIDRSVFLASILSPMARGVFFGPCPGFVFGANLRGSGKGKLADIAAMIATGETAPAQAFPEDDEEQEKTIRAVAFGGQPVVLFDNVTGSIGGKALDVYLTATKYAARVFRTTDNRQVPAHTVLYFTGNNVIYHGDTSRRILPIRLESKTDRPENRSFKVGDISGHTRSRRDELFGYGLDILRAYMLDGRPAYELPSFGSFEGWSPLIRGALLHAGMLDPVESRSSIEVDNSETAEHERFLSFLHARFGDQPFTASDVADLVDEPMNEYPVPMNRTIAGPWTLKLVVELFDLLTVWDRPSRKANRKSLGRRLQKYTDRPAVLQATGRLGRLTRLKAVASTGRPQWKVLW